MEDKVKKRILLVLGLCGLLTVQLFAGGIGLEVGIKSADNLVAGPSLVIGGNWTMLEIDWLISKNSTYVGAAWNYRFLELEDIADIGIAVLQIDFFVGAFGNANIPNTDDGTTTGENIKWDGGLRLPVRAVLDFGVFEIFAQIAPAVALVFVPSFGFGGMRGSAVTIGAQLMFG
jgi:hypothetical protein